MSDTVNYRPRNPAATKADIEMLLARIQKLEMQVRELSEGAGGEPVTAKRGRPAKEKEE